MGYAPQYSGALRERWFKDGRKTITLSHFGARSLPLLTVPAWVDIRWAPTQMLFPPCWTVQSFPCTTPVWCSMFEPSSSTWTGRPHCRTCRSHQPWFTKTGPVKYVSQTIINLRSIPGGMKPLKKTGPVKAWVDMQSCRVQSSILILHPFFSEKNQDRS